MTPSTETRAFEAFLRRGRVPEAQRAGLSKKALGDARPTNHYTWRTARDERVRGSHAANAGRIFSWNDPPTTGHPGQEPNCRCSAEPYYGTPMVPDATLPLSRQFQADTSGREHWASIETYTRPDGSLARSAVALRDGSRIQSSFIGSQVTHTIGLPDGQQVRVEKRDGVQTVYRGNSDTPVLQSFLRPDRLLVTSPGRPAPGSQFDDIRIFDPAPIRIDPNGGGLGAVIGLGLLALFNLLQSRPDALGEGAADKPILGMRAWQVDKKPAVETISLTTVTVDHAQQYCKSLPEVQKWTNDAVSAVLAAYPGLGPAAFGSKVHLWIKQKVDDLETLPDYTDLRAEYSMLPGEEHPVPYGSKGSTRLDVLEDRRKETGYVCVYDVKTGNAVLDQKRLLQIAATVLKHFGSAPFLLFEVKPTP